MYLIISVGKNNVNASEWECDHDEDSCKYAETFQTWSDLLQVLGQYMVSYMYIRVVDDTEVC